jgi:2-phosphoglycerate kinase
MALVLMLLGGPPRCGKTLLAQRVATHRGIGWLSLDTVRDVVNMLLPGLYEAGGPGVGPDDEANVFFPYFERVVESCAYLTDEYIVEGIGFMPRHVAAVRVDTGVRAVFVGMRHVVLEDLLAFEGRNRWHRHLDASTLSTVPAWIESWSRQLSDECDEHQLPFVDLSEGFVTGQERAFDLLVGKAVAG